MWHGDYAFVLQNLVLKDFRVRYRNMSLGAFWSLLNPLIMMTVLTLVFTVFMKNNTPHYTLKVLCGLVPFNFFTLSWANGTTSLIENAGLIKRVPIPREVVPISTVLSNCLNLLIQLGVLFAFTLGSGFGVNRNWLWIPVICVLFVMFVMGLALASAALDVYLRDMRYVVESVNLVLFWMVPIVYSFDTIPPQFKDVYSLNPISAMVMAMQNILMQATAPAPSLLWKLTFASFLRWPGDGACSGCSSAVSTIIYSRWIASSSITSRKSSCWQGDGNCCAGMCAICCGGLRRPSTRCAMCLSPCARARAWLWWDRMARARARCST